MDRFHSLILVVIVMALLAGAGCTTTTPSSPADQAAATPAPVSALASLALTPSEVPAGYVLTSTTERTPAEMSPMAISLGWQGGYSVVYTNSSASSGSQDRIFQNLTTYTVTRIPEVVALISQQEQAGTDIVITNITPGFGENSGGYIGKTPSQMSINAQRELSLDTHSLLGGSSSAVAQPTEDFAMVYFSKGTTMEVIRMTGPHTSAEAITAIARTAYAKIP
ncbi:hypothetical protein [Methanoregula sp.]|uniref:hypothetical protein n=1 Tax=Methanoregula sp. TaxID=2052170 RepID=UPI0023748ABB|nr:hypothetical protein [Methanoregula sp.]MDD1686065.1 hypothetical protein [Methanoregula sp.]